MKAKKLTELAMLTSLALIIFIVELQIPNPIPLPGIKLGLANIITVYAVYRYKAREVLLVVLCRTILGSIFGGNMMALLYSLACALWECCILSVFFRRTTFGFAVCLEPCFTISGKLL